jgi:hypothetical protein
MLDADVLTDNEVRNLGLPSHCPIVDLKDPLEWGRIPTELECSVCAVKVARTLEVPQGVSVAKKIPFTCAVCNSPIGRRKQTLAIKPAKRRGRPKKVCPENGQEPQSSGLILGLAASVEAVDFLSS